MAPKRNRSSKNSDVVLMRRLLKRERHILEDGKVLRVPSHPPEFTAVPWNQLTWRLVGNNVTVSNDVIVNALLTQLSLASGQRVDVRLHSIRFWGEIVSNTSTTPLPAVGVRFRSLIPNVFGSAASEANYPVIQECRDYPDQVRRASVGYEWPLAQQSLSISAGFPNTFVIANVFSGSGANSLMYFRGWWRPVSA
jgi:hypothetical protein